MRNPVTACRLDKKQFPGSEKITPATVLLSSTLKPAYRASNCIDGILQVKTDAKSMCHSKKESAPWLALDFGKEARFSVEKVVIINRRAGRWAKRTRNIQIRLSNGLPASGKEMFSGGEALGTFKGPATPGQKVEIDSGPGWGKKTGRYLIVQNNFGNPGDHLNLQEVYAVGISGTLRYF